MACILAANQCDNNIQGKPFFIKSLLKATFIAENFLESETVKPSTHAELSLFTYEEWVSQTLSNPKDSFGLLSYNDWNEQSFNYFIQMYNSVIQILDFRLEVVYPLEYIASAFPSHPERELLLFLCRTVLKGPKWSLYILNSLV